MAQTTAQKFNQIARMAAQTHAACMQSLDALGPKPLFNANAARQWQFDFDTIDRQAAQLEILQLRLGGLAISNSVDEIWKDLDEIEAITDSVQASIENIDRISRRIAIIAKIITLGVEVVEAVTLKTPKEIGDVKAAYDAVLKALKGDKSAEPPELAKPAAGAQ